MSEFTEQEIIGNEGVKILDSLFDAHSIDFNPQGKHDNTADIDGYMRLRDGVSTNETEFLFFQIKSKKKVNPKKFNCSKKVLDFLYKASTPTLLFVVDTTKKEAYWYYPSEERKAKMDGLESKTIDLTDNRISTGSSGELRSRWSEFAKRTDSEEQNKQIKDIKESLNSNVSNIVGVFFLLQRLKKDKIISILQSLLKISEADSTLIISKLLEKNIITETESFYIVENIEVGVDAMFELFKVVEPSKFLEVFEDAQDRKILLGKIAEIKHKKAESFLKSLIDKAIQLIATPTTNDELFGLIELIETFSYRFPNEIIKLVKGLMNTKPIPPVTILKFSDGDVYGKEYNDLLSKGVELLKDIRYFKPKAILSLLVELSRNESKTVCSHAIEAIKHLAEYNLPILKKVEYHPQLLITEELGKWGPRKLKTNRDAILKICEELLDPSFEGTSWSKNTMTLTTGPLVGNEKLKEVRKSAITLLQKLYKASKDVDEKKAVVTRLQGASSTPHQHGASEELLKIIHSDTEKVIEFYNSLLGEGLESEIIKEIDEDMYWLSQRSSASSIKGLKDIRLKIASNTEFQLFRVFVGYDAYQARDGNWQETKQTREEQIEGFVNEFSQETFDSWKKKILRVLKNYSPTNRGEYIYLGRFLYLLGKNKPELALKLVYGIGPKLGYWLTHLVAGISISDKKSMEHLFKKWIKDGKNLTVISDAIGYEHEPNKIEVEIPSLILNKAINLKDIEALRSIVRISFNNYSKNKKLKKLFIDGAKKLTELKDSVWLFNIWTRKETLLDDLTKKEAETILNSLMLLDNLDYHGEEILASIGKKYPELIIDFFLRRIGSKSKHTRSLGSRYTAIPYDLHGLQETLRENESKILPKILSWFGMGGKKNNWLYKWEASHFIEKIFPRGFSDSLTKHLINLVKSKDKKKLDIVILILDKYEDATQIWTVCQEIVKNYSSAGNYKELKPKLFGMLSDTGVVTGEDGFVRAFEAKRTEVESFNTDGIQSLKDFQKEYIDYLNIRIEFERKRADESTALRDRGMW